VIKNVCLVSAFHREIDEIGALLGCYAAYSGNSVGRFGTLVVPTFLDFFTLAYETDRLSRNVGKEWILDAV